MSRGLVNTIGCSNLAAWQIMKALGISDKRGYARFETVQAYYSIAGRELEREIVPVVEDQGLGVMVWSPLAGGFLSGKYTRDKRGDNDSRRTVFDFPPVDKERAYDIIDAMAPIAKAHDASVARVALAWLLQRKGVMSVIIGAKTIEQLDDNLAAAEVDARARRDRETRRGERAEARISGLDAGAAGRRPRAGAEGVEDFRRSRPGGDLNGRGSTLRKVKWGVIGVAKIAIEKVIPAMQRGEVSEIAAIASRDLGKARAAADKLGIPRAYGSYEELLADPEIEAIYNPLPNEVHVPWTLQRARGRQARVVREADRARRRGSAAADRSARPVRQAGRRGLHGAFPSAMAPRPRACA